VTFEDLQAIPRLCLPDASGLVGRGGEHAAPLWAKGNLGDLSLVARQNCLACARHGIVDARVAVCRRGDELAARGIKGDVEDLVVVSSQRVDTCARLHVPHLKDRGKVREVRGGVSGMLGLRAKDTDKDAERREGREEREERERREDSSSWRTLQVRSMEPEMHRSDA